MAWRVKVFAAQLGDLGLMPWTHTMEEGPNSCKVSSAHTHAVACEHVHTAQHT